MNRPHYKRVIQLELNEITFPVLETLMARNELPTFKKIHNSWKFLETHSETEYDKIEPWIQWVTAHTGKSFEEHQIYRLGDVHNLEYHQIWEELSMHGIESGIIGSMNTMRGNAKGGVFFPDPWSKGSNIYPAQLQSLWELISSRVKGHATSDIGIQDMFKGLMSCLSLRLHPQVFLKIGHQILNQKLNKLNKWKLAAVFDEFLAAIFRSVLHSTNFGYYTLFLNSVAHYQHHYWRNFDRSVFNPEIHYNDIAPNHDPITHGYKAMDKILASILKSINGDKDTLVIILSGLSQEPYTEKEKTGGMNYYRLIDHQAFAQRIGIGEDYEVYPLMSRDWQIKYPDDKCRLQALKTLDGLTVNGESLFSVKENTEGYIFIETKFCKGNSAGAMILDGDGKPVCPFQDAFSNIAIKSGHHSGQGCFWISDGSFSPLLLEKEIPLTSVYALTLEALGIQRPKTVAPIASQQKIHPNGLGTYVKGL